MCPRSVGEARWSLKPSEGVRDFVCDFNPCTDRDWREGGIGLSSLRHSESEASCLLVCTFLFTNIL